MTIDEAIKLLTAYSENMETDLIDTEYAAIRLGIEALKRIKVEREIVHLPFVNLLRGETLEKED
jgi:sRNA-binding carbon storage regulator CsrA